MKPQEERAAQPVTRHMWNDDLYQLKVYLYSTLQIKVTAQFTGEFRLNIRP